MPRNRNSHIPLTGNSDYLHVPNNSQLQKESSESLLEISCLGVLWQCGDFMGSLDSIPRF